jgi:DNA helicase II / ATP-dependent DNA helicase PcrA
VHRVKGLEWPHVVVHDVTSGQFPHRLSTDVEEERRVFHVAITRAIRSLTLVADEQSPSMFLDELTTSPAEEAAAPPTTARSARPAIEVSEGLAFWWGGYECIVQRVEPQHVAVKIGASTVTIPFGSEVLVNGEPRTLSSPKKSAARSGVDATSVDNPATFDALKAWRLERSRKDGVPAYVVASDRTLAAIAAAMPTDEADLLGVSGIGATKIELYGNDLLAILDATRPAS